MVVPVSVVVALAAIELRLPSGLTVIPLFVAVPALAGIGIRCTWRVLHVGGLTLIATGATGYADRPAWSAVTGVSLVGVAMVTALTWLSVVSFMRQARTLTNVRAIAETVQQVLLRPIPRRVGALRTEVRYLAAAAEARVGGDVYDVLSTPFGIRLLIGDVMGKGLSAVEQAADLLGAFRELAHHESRLSGVAERMDALLAHRGDGHIFATAILVTIPDKDNFAELVCCGHPPPLLLRGSQVTFVDVLPPSPPLGLLDLADGWCQTSIVPFYSGDQLLLYTDGVTEARDADGRFYPLPERLAALSQYQDNVSTLLDALGADLRRHTADRLQDDAALLLVQRDRSHLSKPGRSDRYDTVLHEST